MKSKPTQTPIKTKWLFVIVGLLVIYAVIQPIANHRWGWKLPSLDSLLSDSQTNNDQASLDAEDRRRDDSVLSNDSDELLHGILTKTERRDEYLSPAGLRYTRGSEEGHRLKHLARHLEDIPDRPGRHGVFDGDMRQALVWIDDAYRRAAAGERGTTKSDEESRTVYEANFSTRIGYIGGREGKRLKNPESKRLRLVVDGDRVITAFPF